jgi:hypothetical protein
MISEAIEPQRWPASRWWTLIGLVLAAQFGLIFWLGKPHVAARPPADSAPSLELSGPGAATVVALTDPSLLASLRREGFFGSSGAGATGVSDPADPSSKGAAQLLALTDPTLLALPHREGFSGAAWLFFSPQHLDSAEWSQAQRWLELGEGQFGSEFKDFMATNQFEALPSLQEQEVDLKFPAFEQPELLPVRSRLWLAGGLAERRLLVSPDLPPWPSREVLTNSVVTLWVDANGLPVSAPTLLPPGSGSADADQRALQEARQARFEPLRIFDPTDLMAGLAWGQLIFEWRTLPLPATNNAAEPNPPK